MNKTLRSALRVLLLGLLAISASANAAIARQVTPLATDWRFRYEPGVAAPEVAQPGFADADWERVSIPHTWNAQDAQSTAESYARGHGVYRKIFKSPDLSGNRRAWLEFQAVSIVADVWLNGQKIGHHEGGFATFRIDATAALHPTGDNILVVVADNSNPANGGVTSHVLPFSGDFNIFGGIYRDVSLIVTGPEQIDLGDDGGAGSYATLGNVDAKRAEIALRTRLRSTAASPRNLILRATLRDVAQTIVARVATPVTTQPGSVIEVAQALTVANPKLWDGTKNPYLHRMSVELLDPSGQVLDDTGFALGLRDIKFDAKRGLLLNGQPVKLHGVDKHQDFYGKGWVTAPADIALDMAMLHELGANTIRMAHYQHNQLEYDLADRYGIIVYTEIPLIDTPVPSSELESIPDDIIANARQQLRELIRQNQNHASIGFWGVANEVAFTSRYSPKVEKDLSRLFEQLRAEATADDPSRPTIQANIGDRSDFNAKDGLAALNRYYGWYEPNMDKLLTDAAEWHEKRPEQPIALSEYGFGASTTQHTDDARVIAPENLVAIARGSFPNFMPEEYQAYGHEQIWHRIMQQDQFFGTYVWVMFDFPSAGRREADYLAQGFSLNNKGLVSYDRRTRKDAFYYYKAHWNPEKMLHLTGQNYVDRSYKTTDVKAYSNLPAASLHLILNGKEVSQRPSCAEMVCLWREIALRPGQNVVRVEGETDGKKLTDSANWNLEDRSGAYRIRVGSFVPMIGFQGARWGSDSFLTEASLASSSITGNKRSLPLSEALRISDNLPRLRKVVRQAFTSSEPLPQTPELFMNYREGTFTYDIPQARGLHHLRLSFFEPDEKAVPGARLFRILVNGQVVEPAFDIVAAADNTPRKAVVRDYVVAGSDDRMRISFEPVVGKAVLCGIEITP